MKSYIITAIFLIAFSIPLCVNAQQGVGINNDGSLADPKALLDIKTSTKGFLLPRLTNAQRDFLGTTLTATQAGMQVSDSATGELYFWTGTQWTNTARLGATPPVNLNMATNTFSLNAGTQAGDLLTWDGNNWISMQPPVKFTDTLNNMQPYQTINFLIAEYGLFPVPNDAQPYIGQIMMVGFNFAPPGFYTCDGQLLDIANHDILFALIGTTYGGDGQVTYALPDLRGRAAMHFGQGTGLSNYYIGETSGIENQIISH